MVETPETESQSTVISAVDESPEAGASQNEQFGAQTQLGSEQSGTQQDAADSSGSTDIQEIQQQRMAAEKKARDELEQKQLEQDQAEIQKLKARDLEVRQHEAAHAAVGGAYAGAPTYDYQTGPDGKRYAVGGEVQISTSKVSGDPQKTLEKAQQIRAAALAPAEPSAQDRRVAAMASQTR